MGRKADWPLAKAVEREVCEVLDLDYVPRDDFSLLNLRKLIIKRGDVRRIGDIVRFACNVRNRHVTLREAYWTYKEYRWEAADQWLYETYCEQVDAVLGGEWNVRMRVFARQGTAFLRRMEDWIGGAANDAKETVRDFFRLILPLAHEHSPVVVASPASLLHSYGWDLWEQAIREMGGRRAYLRPLSDDRLLDERRMLREIEEFMMRCRINGHLDVHDDLGNYLAEHGVERTHREVFRNR